MSCQRPWINKFCFPFLESMLKRFTIVKEFSVFNPSPILSTFETFFKIKHIIFIIKKLLSFVLYILFSVVKTFIISKRFATRFVYNIQAPPLSWQPIQTNPVYVCIYTYRFLPITYSCLLALRQMPEVRCHSSTAIR